MNSKKADRELEKFVNDPKYRASVVMKVKKQTDFENNHAVQVVSDNLAKLNRERSREVQRIQENRWQRFAKTELIINRTEGKIRIRNTEAYYSQIRGASLNIEQGRRFVTISNSKSKKGVSLGGAIVGGALLGPMGAVAGGVGLGKTKTTGQSVSEEVLTCSHLGVRIDIDGLIYEIVLLNRKVDQTSPAFKHAYNRCEQIIHEIKYVMQLPVPKYISPEDEASIKEIDNQIAAENEKLAEVSLNKKKAVLPEIYRTEEQKDLSDEEYLNYLAQQDSERERQIEIVQNENGIKVKQKAERNSEKPISQSLLSFVKICFLIISAAMSLFMLLVFFATVGMPGGVLSGIIFLITAVLINPLIYKEITKHVFPVKWWYVVLIFVIGFFVGLIFYPVI